LRQSERDALPLQSLGKISCVSKQWAIPSHPTRIWRHLPANPDPLRRFADQCIGDEEHSGERIAHLLRRGVRSAKLNTQRRSAIFRDCKLCKRKAIIPLQEASIRGAKAIAEWWREVRPHHQCTTWARVMYQGNPQPASRVPIKFEIPDGCVLSSMRRSGGDAEGGEKCGNLRRA
jgi:hypothetical protein